MPSWAAIVRLLRRRLVLGVIFAVSLTYCALSLLQHEKQGNLVNSNSDEDPLYFSTGKPYLWQMEVLNEDGEEDQNLSTNSSHPLKNTCRNSIQGKALIVDEFGLVCNRGEVLPSGCCSEDILIKIKENHEEYEIHTQNSIAKRERYSCKTCNPEGCCAVYEYCVSCCLRPSKMDGKRRSDDKESKQNHDQNRRIKKSEDSGGSEAGNSMRHRFRSLDKFQVCLATCRTSSASVRHENTYKDPNSKHCYSLLNQNSNYNQRYRRDLHHILNINMNNNNNNNNNNNGQPQQAVLAPSSTVSIFFPPST